MKKLFFLFHATLVLACCATSCNPVIPPVEKFTITAIAGPNGNVAPSKAIVEKGGSASFKMTPDLGYLIESLKDNGNALPPLDTYTVMNVSSNDSFEVTFKKDSLLFPLLRITWIQDSWSAFIDGEWVYFGGPYEVVNFTADGNFSNSRNNISHNGKWSLDKSKSPAILVYDGRYFTIEELTEKKMSIYYTNQQGIITRCTYHAG